MLSSNQVLQISCDGGQLQSALQFVMSLEHDRGTNKPDLCWQITKDGNHFTIGWYYDTPAKGWNMFTFPKPSIDLITATVKQFCQDHPDSEPEIFDGGYKQGYLIQAVPESLASETDQLISPFYGIVTIRAYKLFYSK